MKTERHKRWNEPKKGNMPSRITIPPHAHPVARFIFQQMHDQRISYHEMELCSSVLMCTQKEWRRTNVPGINTSDAVLGVLGFTLVPVPLPERLSPELLSDLQQLADKHGVDGDLRTELIASCVARHPITAKNLADRRRALAAGGADTGTPA